MRMDYFFFVLLGVAWGSNFLFMKIAVQTISPVQVAWLRVVFGLLPIVTFGVLRGALKWEHRRWSHHFVAIGLMAMVIPFSMMTKGTQILQSGTAGAMAGIVPLVTAGLAALFLPDERLSLKKISGILVGFFGVALVGNLPALVEHFSSERALGVAYMMVTALSYAGAAVYARRFLSALKIDPVALACYQIMASTVVMSLFTPFAGIFAVIDQPKTLAAVALGLGLFGTGVAYILYYRLIERLGAVSASSVFYVPPVVALTTAALIADETIELTQWAGAGFILLGVWLSKRPEPARSLDGQSSRV